MNLPSRRGQYGDYTVVFAPTLGRYRGRAIGTDPSNSRSVHAVCRHEHSSPEAALNCAATIAKIANNRNWSIK